MKSIPTFKPSQRRVFLLVFYITKYSITITNQSILVSVAYTVIVPVNLLYYAVYLHTFSKMVSVFLLLCTRIQSDEWLCLFLLIYCNIIYTELLPDLSFKTISLIAQLIAHPLQNLNFTLGQRFNPRQLHFFY